MRTNEDQATLVLIGGHEDKEGNREILSRFVELAGGHDAKITIMTSASKKPNKVGEEYRETFRQLDVNEVNVFHIGENGNADRPDVLAGLIAATGIFFVGGEPIRIVRAIKDSPIDKMLHERVQFGAVLAGTSAGALMMPEIVLMDGESQTNPSTDTIEASPGMGFLKGVLIDVHFAERGRCGRMLSAIAKFPNCVGFGIDENTALVVRGTRCEVLGSGSLFVFDPTAPTYENFTPPGCKDFALKGVQLHVLPSGCSYDLATRQPVKGERPANC
jgi:cyanophycinase